MRRYAEGRIFFLLRCASLPENHAKRMCCVTLNMSQASFSHGCFWRPGNQQQPCTGAQQSSCDWLQQHVGCCSSTQEQNIQLAKPCTSVHSLEAPNLPQNRTSGILQTPPTTVEDFGGIQLHHLPAPGRHPLDFWAVGPKSDGNGQVENLSMSPSNTSTGQIFWPSLI